MRQTFPSLILLALLAFAGPASAAIWVIGLVNSAPTSEPIFTAGYEAVRFDSACTMNNGKKTRAKFNAVMPRTD